MALLRDYQQECHDSVLRAWGVEPWYSSGETYRSVIANLATSAGKTVIASAIIQSVMERGRCLFVADTDELCSQPRDTLWNLFRIASSVEKAGRRASMMSNVVIASAQTISREDRLTRFPTDHFSYVFVDEAHRGSDRNKRITDHFAGARVVGMTATAFRARLKDLSAYYDHVAFELGVFDLIDEGYIAPLKVLTLPVEVNLKGVKQTNGDYDDAELDTTIAPYYEAIAKILATHPEVKERQVLVFCPLKKSSQAFARICRDSFNLNAEHIAGDSPDRDRILNAFANKRIRILSNSSLLTTGWDCPSVDCLLNLTPTRLVGIYRQKVGRIIRLLPGVIDGIKDRQRRRDAIAASEKPDALILDLLWQTERFGLMGAADLIAENEGERLALQMKIQGLDSAENLQELASDVQAAREAALKRDLIRTAERLKQKADGIPLIATLLHAKKLANYEPVSKWEGEPVSEKQRAWLIKNGIDVASAKNRGHVSALMTLIIDRQRAGLCSHRVVAALEEKGVGGAMNFTDMRAYGVLGHDFPFPFGRHIGKPFRRVPLWDWKWLAKQTWVKLRWPVVWRRMIDMELIKDKTADDRDWFRSGSTAPPPAVPIDPPDEASQMFDVLT